MRFTRRIPSRFDYPPIGLVDHSINFAQDLIVGIHQVRRTFPLFFAISGDIGVWEWKDFQRHIPELSRRNKNCYNNAVRE
jgi:hypothetical protein